jgi:two-component sensor histidine kinase
MYKKLVLLILCAFAGCATYSQSLSVSPAEQLKVLVKYPGHDQLNVAMLLKLSNQYQYGAEDIRTYIMVGGVSMVVLLVAISYAAFRSRQRLTQELEQQKQQINKQNASLQLLLYEKDWLLKEIHHRVKNNLQIVISLLNSQSAYLENEDALFAIRNSQHRMHAMSLIHQKLYQSTNLASIDLSAYIYELVGYLKESFETDHKIKYVLDLTTLKLDVAQAVPIGLILNEAITNAIKYAFEKDAEGKITILLQSISDDTYLLCIADNGRGLPVGFNHENSRSLGMSLMIGLTEQLEGSLSLEEDGGLRVCIRFKKLDALKLIKKDNNS